MTSAESQPKSYFNFPNQQPKAYTQTSSPFSSQPNQKGDIYYQIAQPSNTQNPSMPSSQQFQQLQKYPQISNNPNLLLLFYNPNRVEQTKAQNQKKYQIRPDSPLYSFSPTYLNSLLKRYPQDFPGDLSAKIQRDAKEFQRQANNFTKLGATGIIYWSLLRTRTWFKLTGSAIMRVYFVFACFYNVGERKAASQQHFFQTIFTNKTAFQNIFTKYQIDAKNVTQQEMFSFS